jgi:hypothetical protein
MRRLTLAVAALLAALAAPACKRPTPRVDTIEDENLPALSFVRAADWNARAQLLSGFHQIEEGGWRWTTGKFSVILAPPPGAAQKGARLVLDFSVPEVVIARRKSVTLSAAVEGHPLAPETCPNPGQYTYSRDVPAVVLGASAVKIDFALDKFLAAGEIERRELGVVVRSVALEPK